MLALRKRRRQRRWMASSFPAAGRPTNCGAIRPFCNSCAICTSRVRLLARSVMAAGFPSRRALYAATKLPVRPASRMISPTRAASGSTNRLSAKATLSGGALWKIFRCFAGNWWLLSLNSDYDSHKINIYGLVDWMKVRDVIKLIEADGWYLISTEGDHRQYKHPTKRGRVTVVGHPGKEVPPGTLISIFKQAQTPRRR